MEAPSGLIESNDDCEFGVVGGDDPDEPCHVFVLGVDTEFAVKLLGSPCLAGNGDTPESC
jgi:hypothetical protein